MYKRIVFGHYDSNGDLTSRLSFPYTNSYTIFFFFFFYYGDARMNNHAPLYTKKKL
jgi:hypothetical protein